MKNMKQIADGVNVSSLLEEIKANPQLWNKYTARTENPASPHHVVSDIWLRHNPIAHLNKDDPKGLREFVAGEHDSVWYEAIDLLPSAREICMQLMAFVGGERLGGVLITRIPPGCSVKPHTDRPSWHAEYYDKYAVQLQGNPDQSFNFDGEVFCALPGDVYWFDNGKEHWVVNDSNEDRMTMIVCVRHDKGARGD